MPTTFERDQLEAWVKDRPLKGVHESLLRSYNILRKVKELLDQGVPGAVVLELIDLMETDTKEIRDTPDEQED